MLFNIYSHGTRSNFILKSKIYLWQIISITIGLFLYVNSYANSVDINVVKKDLLTLSEVYRTDININNILSLIEPQNTKTDSLIKRKPFSSLLPLQYIAQRLSPDTTYYVLDEFFKPERKVNLQSKAYILSNLLQRGRSKDKLSVIKNIQQKYINDPMLTELIAKNNLRHALIHQDIDILDWLYKQPEVVTQYLKDRTLFKEHLSNIIYDFDRNGLSKPLLNFFLAFHKMKLHKSDFPGFKFDLDQEYLNIINYETRFAKGKDRLVEHLAVLKNTVSNLSSEISVDSKNSILSRKRHRNLDTQESDPQFDEDKNNAQSEIATSLKACPSPKKARAGNTHASSSLKNLIEDPHIEDRAVSYALKTAYRFRSRNLSEQMKELLPLLLKYRPNVFVEVMTSEKYDLANSCENKGVVDSIYAHLYQNGMWEILSKLNDRDKHLPPHLIDLFSQKKWNELIALALNSNLTPEQRKGVVEFLYFHAAELGYDDLLALLHKNHLENPNQTH